MPHKAQGHKAQKAAGDTPYVAAVRAWFRARIVLLPPNSPELQKPTKDRQKMYNWQLFGDDLNKAQIYEQRGHLHDELDGGIPVAYRSGHEHAIFRA